MDKKLHALAETLRPEWVVQVKGEVAQRPEGMANPKEPSGGIEVKVFELTVLAESKTPPFDLAGDGYEIGEDVRMQYRYLDLRRARLVRNLRERARVLKFMRDFLTERGFVEIETPILGSARLSRSGAASSRRVLCSPAVPPAVQTAFDGGRS